MILPRNNAELDLWKKTIIIEASNYMSSFKLLLFGICCGINKLNKDGSVERIELYHPTLAGKSTMINNIEDNNYNNTKSETGQHEVLFNKFKETFYKKPKKKKAAKKPKAKKPAAKKAKKPAKKAGLLKMAPRKDLAARTIVKRSRKSKTKS